MSPSLDEIADEIGFTATLKLVAWFGDGISNMFVPAKIAPGQLLPKLVGQSAAEKMGGRWPNQHVAIPSLKAFEVDVLKRQIQRLVSKGMSTREVANFLKMREARVVRALDEMVAVGLAQAPLKAVSKASQALGAGEAYGHATEAMLALDSAILGRTMPASQPVAQAPVKRGRGRPRKVALPVTGVDDILDV